MRERVPHQQVTELVMNPRLRNWLNWDDENSRRERQNQDREYSETSVDGEAGNSPFDRSEHTTSQWRRKDRQENDQRTNEKFDQEQHSQMSPWTASTRIGMPIRPAESNKSETGQTRLAPAP